MRPRNTLRLCGSDHRSADLGESFSSWEINDSVLGPVDGFDQDYAAGQGDKGGVVLCGFLASHGDPHSFYLRNMYLYNRMREPNGITLGGEGIDLRRTTIPQYFLSASEDHIAPWKSTYAGTQLVSGPVRFVLGASGHIAGAMNPPAAILLPDERHDCRHSGRVACRDRAP